MEFTKLITIDEFSEIELRVGTIEEALPFKGAINPSYKLKIDFGPYGKKWSSAQITVNYNAEDLIGRQIVSVMNLGIKKIGDFKSEVLVLGHNDKNGNVILLEPDKEIKNGALVN
tara:strand:- start:31 stop:375 length:345 start_codon:yes stop_codon:yes gene_type:complete